MVVIMKRLLIIVVLICEGNCNTLSRYLLRTERGLNYPDETYSGSFDGKKYTVQDLLGELETSAGERAAFGNMKQFFSDLKKSLDGETFQPPTNSGSAPFLKKKGKTGSGPHGETSSFVFPHHIRRMMFGSQHSQPYSHSSLGR